MRTVYTCLFTLALAACGSGNAPDDKADSGPNGGTTWTLQNAPIREIASEDPAVIHPERTTRLLVTTELVSSCEDRAMPVLTWNQATYTLLVEMRVWHPRGIPCEGQAEAITRPLAVKFPAPGSWSVEPGPAGASGQGTTVEVMAAPNLACDQGRTVNCELDCDCPAGQACLGGSGFTGPFTQCEQPCELNRDCGGNGRCVTAGTGLSDYCDSQVPECDAQNACPAGYTCDAGTCRTDVLLGTETRVVCTGDADCAAPLRCVESAQPDGLSRCEMACLTESGGWCTIMHYCGEASADTAGLAETDSVCIWAGE